MLLYFAFVLTVAFVTALILTPLTIRFARKMNWLDQPAPRRLHQVPTPRIGGIPLAIAILAGLAVTVPFQRTDENEWLRVLGLAAGILVVAIVGWIDDVKELKPLPLFAMQFGVALIALGSGVVLDEIGSPLDGSLIVLPPILAVAFTIFWIMGMMNTVNFLDGLDGLVGGVTVIAGAVLFMHNYKLTQYSLALLALALIGATLGFLIFNFPPAKIFLGSGAYVLGFALAVLAIIGGTKAATALLVLAVPILDVAWQIVIRFREGRPVFSADRGHLHIRLYDSGVSKRVIVLIYYVVTALFGVLALALPQGLPKTVSLIVIGGAALLVLARLRKGQ